MSIIIASSIILGIVLDLMLSKGDSSIFEKLGESSGSVVDNKVEGKVTVKDY